MLAMQWREASRAALTVRLVVEVLERALMELQAALQNLAEDAVFRDMFAKGWAVSEYLQCFVDQY